MDTFVAKLDVAGSGGLGYSTFLGGSGWEYDHSIAVDTSGNAYVTGYTDSSGFPTTPGTYDTSHNGNDDTFVTKLDMGRDDITDVCWDQAATSVLIAFASDEGIEYELERADADAYDDGLTWYSLPGDLLIGTILQDVFTDDLTANPLTHAFRFYRVRRTDGTNTSRQTVGVFEMTLDPGLSPVYYISTPLVPDLDHRSVPQVFGENAARQMARGGFTVSDLVESTGQINRERNNTGTFTVISGSAFDIVAGRAYELQLGSGPSGSIPLRLTGYVSETALSVDLTKTGAQALQWFAYSMPRTVKLSSLNLPTVISPWVGTNRVRILWHGSFAYINYTYAGGTWSPSDPDLVPGTGMMLTNNGPAGAKTLMEETWYLHPPNAW